jgi:single-strand DNA-binding protein
MIKMQVIGHLGKDCQVNLVNEKNVMNFSVAHSEKYRDSAGEMKERTLWVECSYWTDRTAVAAYLKKGTQVFVEGNPDVKTFTRNDGTPGVSLLLRVLGVQLIGGKSEGNSVKPVGEPVGVLVEEGSNDLPF